MTNPAARGGSRRGWLRRAGGLLALPFASGLLAQSGSFPSMRRLADSGRFARARAEWKKLYRELPKAQGSSLPAGRALNRARRWALLPPLAPHPKVEAAARAHATYLKENFSDRELGFSEAHEETPGQVGFTGVRVGDRLEFQGLRASSTEGVTSVFDPEEAVESLLNSVYHRAGLLEPRARFFGYGRSNRSVVDLAWEDPAPDFAGVILYPAPGQTGVPPVFPGGETPEPLPGTTYPVGPPLSVGGARQRPRILALRLEGAEGEVPVRILTERTSPRTDLFGKFAFAVPLKPLEPESLYRVEAKVRRRGRQEDLAWSFRTGSKVPGRVEVQVSEIVLDPPEPKAGQALRIQARTKASHPQHLEVQLRWDGRPLPGKEGLAELRPQPGAHRIDVRAQFGAFSRAYAEARLWILVPDPNQGPGIHFEPPPPFPAGRPVTISTPELACPDPVEVSLFHNGERLATGPQTRWSWTPKGSYPHRFRVTLEFPGGTLERRVQISRP